MSLYEIEVKDAQQNLTTLEAYRGKVLLIVNTATGCGFTPQYEGLETLYKQYKDQGFEVLDFPCNQFGNQAPGTQADIDAFCSLNYNTTFPRFAKVDVNGDAASPLFTYLKKQRGVYWDLPSSGTSPSSSSIVKGTSSVVMNRPSFRRKSRRIS
jgi:glutathione peroxidase